MLVLSVIGAASAQQIGEKIVEVNQPARIGDAVMISNVAVAGKSLECRLFVKPPDVVQPVTPFQADSDWFQQMTISLINRTMKPVAYGVILLFFPDTGDCHSQPCIEAEFRFGKLPPIDAFDGRTGRPVKLDNPERSPIDWKGEQTITIHTADYLTEVEQRLANFMPLTSVTKVRINLGPFYFEDGMQWNGNYSVPDPEHPGKFKPLPANYFPGYRAHNWPPGYNR